MDSHDHLVFHLGSSPKFVRHAFEHALAAVDGADLARVLWLRSRHAEHWLQRRTNYTRSLAVMSMVGYILGLGDRHPSNLMLDRHSGKVLHIDFGDCFEVALHRDKFPERVPFRLTRSRKGTAAGGASAAGGAAGSAKSVSSRLPVSRAMSVVCAEPTRRPSAYVKSACSPSCAVALPGPAWPPRLAGRRRAAGWTRRAA